MGANKHYLICVSRCSSLPKWTLGGRNEDAYSIRGTPSPGPGSYPMRSTVSNDKGFGFGSGARGSLGQNVDRSIPGAGLYNPGGAGAAAKKIRGGSWGPPPRKSKSKAAAPGPGSYSFKSTLGGKSMGFGPAVYSRAPRKKLDNVGPGKYSVQKRPESAPPAWSFGSSQRPHPAKSSVDPRIPGLDALSNIRSTLGERSCTMGKQFPLASERWELRPEPATYPSESTLEKRSCSFGRAARPMSAPPRYSKTGPGSYDVGSTLRRNTSDFGRGAERGSAVAAPASSTGSVGPGQYPLKSTMEVDGRGFDFTRGDRSDPALGDPNTPGPGYYAKGTTLGKDRSPTWRINMSRARPNGNTRAEQRQATLPGPAAYDRTVSREGPGFSVGTGNRPPLSTAQKGIPGPGAYDVDRSVGGGPAPTQKGRWGDEKRYEKSPDPGSYEADYTSFGY